MARRSCTISKTIDVDVDIDIEIEDFDDCDLIDELEERGYVVNEIRQLNVDPIFQLYQAYITESDAGFRRTAAKVFWEHLGKTI